MTLPIISTNANDNNQELTTKNEQGIYKKFVSIMCHQCYLNFNNIYSNKFELVTKTCCLKRPSQYNSQ